MFGRLSHGVSQVFDVAKIITPSSRFLSVHCSSSTYQLHFAAMPAPKTKSSAVPANGSAKGKAPSTSGTATPISIADKDTSDQFAAFAGGKPDKKLYDAEQARIKTEIDAFQLKLASLFPPYSSF